MRKLRLEKAKPTIKNKQPMKINNRAVTTKSINDSDNRKEVLFVSGKELEEKNLTEIQFSDLNEVEWETSNIVFATEHSFIYMN